MKTLFQTLRTRAPYTDAAALMLRLSLGGMMALHGVGKWAVVGLDVVGEDMVANGFPYWAAYVSVAVEVVSGVLLVVGRHTRLAAVLLLGGGRWSLDGRA